MNNLSAIPSNPQASDLKELVTYYKRMLKTIMQVIVARYKKKPNYPWIDTKIDLLRGTDFAQDDPLRGPQMIYGWIQGRALEALVEHILWMRRKSADDETDSLCNHMQQIIIELLQQLQTTRRKNNGHLFFSMTVDGAPVALTKSGNIRKIELTQASPFNYSDLFAAKGMYAATRFLENSELLNQAKSYCLAVDDALWHDNFASDQQQFHSQNKAPQEKQGRPFGPYMIQIGTAALLAEHEQDNDAVEMGLRLIEYILQNHVNLNNRWPELQDYDLCEQIDDASSPFQTNGRVLSCPGHALEFVGLALKFTNIVKKRNLAAPQQKQTIERIESLMPALLQQNFRNGFNPAGGIFESVDLLARKPINSNMPWWSLPETMRAALACHKIASTDKEKQLCLDIFAACHNAFVEHYVRPELHGMAYQTLDRFGKPVDAIPATPDADPGYHTGLSMIDCLEYLSKV
ncbi:MAG: hypothetical protein GWP06_11010 [Actinobacteria bacterium]|nr:hypothetical protein [Actinomycetota bacterium]